jgi:hypothetical protein
MVRVTRFGSSGFDNGTRGWVVRRESWSSFVVRRYQGRRRRRRRRSEETGAGGAASIRITLLFLLLLRLVSWMISQKRIINKNSI